MNKKSNSVKNFGDIRGLLPENILSKWMPDIHAADDSDGSVINIYDVIGEDFWTGAGMTGKIVSSVLRKNKGKEITVNINSPGGSFFEGLAIYNLLKEHDGDVIINVVGMAASAASIIAMAGTNIKVAEAGFLMIHNAWSCICGNKNDMRNEADTLAAFDSTMADLYAKKTSLDFEEISLMMDNETWISGKDAVALGFATSTLDSDLIDDDGDAQSSYNKTLKEVDVALAKAGHSRNSRRSLLKDLTSTPGATVENNAMPGAGETVDAIGALIDILNKK